MNDIYLDFIYKNTSIKCEKIHNPISEKTQYFLNFTEPEMSLNIWLTEEQAKKLKESL